MTTLADLVQERTKEQMRELLLLALKGVGFVSKSGPGTGSLALSGAAAGDFEVVVRISTAGELGAAEMEVSTDGGDTFEAAETIPSDGEFEVPDTGVTLLFANGDDGESFSLGDEFTFEVATPTLEATAWQPGSVPLSLVGMDSEAMADYEKLRAKIAAGGFRTTAEDAWLDLWLEDVYDLERRRGLPTIGNVTLTDAANAGPFTILAGALWVGTSAGLKFVNATGGTLTQGGTLTLSFRADRVGTQHNVAGGGISVMFTPLPGVTVSNPNPMGGSWITQAGTNRETDDEYGDRATERWPALGVGIPSETYDLWAKTAAPSVTKTKTRNHPSIPGTIQLFLATAAGVASGGVVTAVDDYAQPRVGFTSLLVTASAVAYAYTITATVYCLAGYGAAVVAGITKNLVALHSGGPTTDAKIALPGLDIGDTIYRDAIIEELMRPAGVIRAPMVSPAADHTMAGTEVAVPTASVSMTGSPDILVVEV